jgi:hypothetical protein
MENCIEGLSDTEPNGTSPLRQAVSQELYIREKALLEVETLSIPFAAILQLMTTFKKAKQAVEQCHKSLNAFRPRTQQ